MFVVVGRKRRKRLMQIPNVIRRCVVFLYSNGTAGRRPVGTGFFVSSHVLDWPRSTGGTYLVTAKHIVEGVHRAGKMLHARVNGRGPNEVALWAEAQFE